MPGAAASIWRTDSSPCARYCSTPRPCVVAAGTSATGLVSAGLIGGNGIDASL